jgi:RimJ/RimL family protein N-acetyltransferase
MNARRHAGAETLVVPMRFAMNSPVVESFSKTQRTGSVGSASRPQIASIKPIQKQQEGWWGLDNILLETDRLLLRMWRNDDFDAYAKMCADPDVMRYLGGKTFDQLEAWRHMAFLIGHWELRGYGHWAVEEKATGEFVGRIGFLNPVGWPAFEIGWTLGRQFWGKGYATEGARRALTYAFNELDKAHVISLIHPDNKGSIRVAEHLGEKLEGTTELLGHDVLIYGIDRPVNTYS